ncbi:MAG TPA: DUF4239 domain-containing protein [Vicinamibacteria bacterium]
MSIPVQYALLSLALFVGMLICLELGRRLGAARRAAEGGDGGIGAVDGAVFGLLGLLLAFTFSGAADRFDSRRELIVQEANAIGTAWLRLDLLSPDARETLRAKFRDYLDSRLLVYRKVPDLAAVQAELRRSGELQAEIWTLAISATRAEGSPPQMLLLPALNEMFDITTTRTAAAFRHPPAVVFAMLAGLCLLSALLAGFGMPSRAAAARPWLHMGAYALVMSVAFFVIMNLEYPRLGLIRVDMADQVLVDLRAGMK